MDCTLGIDLGTSSLKVLLAGPERAILATASASYPLHTPKPGWAEQNPADWWRALGEALDQLRTNPDLPPGANIVAVGLSGQMHSLVAVDKGGVPVYPCISWADTRSQAECGEIVARIGRGALIVETGNPPVAAFTASKVLWLRAHEPAAWERTQAILLAKDYLRWCLTGIFAADASDASATLLNTLTGRGWSRNMLDLLDLDPELFPRVWESGEICGTITQAAAAVTGLPAGIPVIAGGGDQECAAVGAGLLDPGPLLITTGTGGQVFAVSGQPIIDRAGRVHSLCHALPGRWHVMAAMQAAGLVLTWATRVMYSAKSPEDGVHALLNEAMMAPLRASSPLFVPDIAGNRTPQMDDAARGVFFGLALSHGRADLARAVVEGIACALRQCVETIGTLGLATEDIWLTGGLSRHAGFRSLLATILQTPIRQLSVVDASALGAATLAGHAVGLWQLEPLVVANQPITDPMEGQTEVIQQRYALYQALYPSLQQRFVQHASITNTE